MCVFFFLWDPLEIPVSFNPKDLILEFVKGIKSLKNFNKTIVK